MTYPQQQGGYGPPPGHGPYPPKKPNTGLVLGITAAVVVAVLGLVLVLVLTGDDDSGPGPTAGGGVPPGDFPEPTFTDGAGPGGADSGPGGGPAEGPADGPADVPADGPEGGGGAGSAGELALTYARIIEEHDVEAIAEYACNAGEQHFLEQDLAQFDGMEVVARPQAVETTSDIMAEVTINLTIQGETTAYPLRMQLRDSSWCAIRVD